MKAMTAVVRVIAQTTQNSDSSEDVFDTSQVTGWDILVALLVLVLSWPISIFLGRLVHRLVTRLPGAPAFAARVARRATRTFVVFTALALAMSLVGVQVGWFAVTLGLVAVMAVLMLRPLVRNLAAGLLIESRPSFRVGDEITTNGHTGQVIAVSARSTVIQTTDWHRIHIPNTEVLSGPIVVLTAFVRRRSSIELEIEYEADLARAKGVLVEAASRVDGVLAEPPPFVHARGFGTATYILSLRWWHYPDLSSESKTLDGVVCEVKRSLDEAGIGLPSPEVIIRRRHEDVRP